MPTIIAIAKKILSDHFSTPIIRGTDHIMIFSEFRAKYAHRLVNDLELTDNDLELVLRYLSSEQGIAIADGIKGYGTTYNVIKFPPKQGEIAEITKHDEALINIRTTCNALSLQVDELQKKSEEFAQLSIKEHTSGHLARARYYLRRKKNLDQVLEKRLRSMETMDTILIKIETSHDDIQVVQAFNAGAGTLRDLLSQDELSIETIQEVMTKVSDSLEEQKKVEDAMQTGLEDSSFDQDLEQELAELVEKEAEPITRELSGENVIQEGTKNESEEQNAVIPLESTSHSELARLKHMFNNIHHTPSSEKNIQKQPELA
ncbi:hypothetical protein BY458DRAFT_434205 [Sporodiniella umbellata]|nr:hypothetical protein BY458DRAFT_434205 [Sporodiniella umbellata]